MRNPEAALFNRMDRQGVFGAHYTGDERFDKLARGWNEVRPLPRDFHGIYSDEEMAQDRARVISIKQSSGYAWERAGEGVALEYAMMESVHNGVLGEDAYVMPTTEYDDVVNGIDFVVGFPDAEGKTATYIGVDVTTTTDGNVIAKKLERTSRQLAQNNVGRIKYFIDDQNPDVRGGLFVPRVVIGVDAGEAQKIHDAMSADRNYSLEPELKAELHEEMELQLVHGLRFLLERFYGPSASSITDLESAEAYLAQHASRIQKQNFRLYENVQRYRDALRALAERAEQKKDPDSTITADAGVLLSSLRRRVY